MYNLLSLAIAVAVQQIGVDLNYETSNGYYEMTGVIALLAALTFVVSAIVLQCKRVPEVEEEKLLKNVT